MPVKLVQSTASAYQYPLLIKQLLLTPLAIAPDQEITYQGKLRQLPHAQRADRTPRQRLEQARRRSRADGGDDGLGQPSLSRVLLCRADEGAILQTVNVRLSPEQIQYTLNHAKADVLLVNSEFFPIVAQIAAGLETVKRFVFFTDEAEMPAVPTTMDAEYEMLLSEASTVYDFPDFDENAQATTFIRRARRAT